MDMTQKVVDFEEKKKKASSPNMERRQKENPFKVKALWLMLSLCEGF